MSLDPNEILFAQFRFSFTEKCLFLGDRLVALTPKEAEILSALLESPGQVVSKDALIAKVWPEGPVDESNLSHHVRSLRKKLGTRDQELPHIENIPGRGYRVAADPLPPPIQTQPLPSPEAPPAPPPIASETSAHRLPRIGLAAVAALVLLAAAAFTFAHRKPPPAQLPADALILTRPDIAQSPRVVKLIPVACVAASAVLNPERGELFVSEVTANSVAIIDVGSNKVIARIPVGREPGAMAFSPDRKKLFIAQGDGLGVIDTATHSFQLASDLKNRVDDVLVMPDGKFAYLALGFLGLAKLDIASRSVKILSKIGYAIALALTPDGRRLYVSYQGGGPGGRFGHDAIGYFDTATDTFAGSISGFANVGGVLAVSRDGSHLWESGADACDSPQYDHVGCPAVPAGLINIFNPNGNKLVRSVAVRGARLLGMTFSPDGQYVAVGSTHGLLLLDSRSYSIVATSPYGSTLKIAFTPDGSKAYSPVNEIPAIAVIQVSVEVRALRLSNRDDRDHALEIGIVTGPDYHAEFIDPESLRLDGVPVDRSASGTLDASVGGLVGFPGHSLIVHFKVEGAKKRSRMALVGKTYAGMPIHGAVDAM